MGLTETVAPAFSNPYERELHKVGAVGLPPGCEAQLVDDTGTEVADGTPGDIVIRGPQVTAGTSFGEMAFIDGSPRSANVVALEPSYCYLLSAEIFSRMTHEWPTLKIQILQGITKLVSANPRRTNREVQTLKR